MNRIGQYGKTFYLVFFLLMITGAAFGQRLKYKTSSVDGVFRGKKIAGEDVIELVNGVEYTQKDTRIFCDSSLFYKKKNLFEAYNNIRILDGDSVTITADTLFYDGKEKKASLTGNVVYTAGTKRLYTDKLDYNLLTKVSYFNTGGRLIDEQNDLTSKIGYYYSRIDQAIFYDSVRLKAESFDLSTDTLKYFTISKVAFTEGPTIIVTNTGNTINNIGGRYETVREKMDLVDGKVETKDYFLEGDELLLDDFTQYYKAIGNVKLTAKNNDVIITGEEGYYNRVSGLSKVYGKPVMKKIMEVDTFYLSSDTLVAIESELDSAKRILGYSDVRIFRENLQAITDSVSYFLADSTIYMYQDPVLWTGENQITGDTISLLIQNQVVDKMYLFRNSFMSSKDTLGNFNQVSGRNMVAQFDQTVIEKVDVLGNGESLYFALSANEEYMLGMNKSTCSNLLLSFTNNELSSIDFYVQPESAMIPPHELNSSLTKLKGFTWRLNERPTLPYVLLRPEKVKPGGSPEDDQTPDSDARKGDSIPERFKEGMKKAPIAPAEEEEEGQ